MKKRKTRVQRGTNGDGTGFGHVKPHHLVHGLLLQDISLSAPCVSLLSSYTPVSKSSCQGTNSHIYRSIAVGPALSQHLHKSVTILFYLQIRKQKSQEGSSSLEDHGFMHCSLI